MERLLLLLTAVFQVLLVFDGSDLPPIKRGVSTKGRGNVNSRPEFRQVALGLGVQTKKAAGDGEAELAMLFQEDTSTLS